MGLKRGDEVVEGAGDAVEEFVHQFGFLHLGDVDDDFLAGAGHPAGFGVGAAAAGEDEDAGVGPGEGVDVGLELALGEGVVEAFGVLGEGPFGGVRVDVGPVEAGAAVGRVAEVVDFVARLAQAPYDFGEVLVSPAGGDVDFCHIGVGLFGFLKDSDFRGSLCFIFLSLQYMAHPKFTPECITELAEGEVFVFGSNLAGCHGGGAARLALERFGAVWGQGVGLQGRSYGIPTMQGGVETIRPYVDEFVAFAKSRPDLFFLVTRIGCGIAGFRDEEIAPLFAEALPLANVALPERFVQILSASQ